MNEKEILESRIISMNKSKESVMYVLKVLETVSDLDKTKADLAIEGLWKIVDDADCFTSNMRYINEIGVDLNNEEVCYFVNLMLDAAEKDDRLKWKQYEDQLKALADNKLLLI